MDYGTTRYILSCCDEADTIQGNVRNPYQTTKFPEKSPHVKCFVPTGVAPNVPHFKEFT